MISSKCNILEVLTWPKSGFLLKEQPPEPSQFHPFCSSADSAAWHVISLRKCNLTVISDSLSISVCEPVAFSSRCGLWCPFHTSTRVTILPVSVCIATLVSDNQSEAASCVMQNAYFREKGRIQDPTEIEWFLVLAFVILWMWFLLPLTLLFYFFYSFRLLCCIQVYNSIFSFHALHVDSLKT